MRPVETETTLAFRYVETDGDKPDYFAALDFTWACWDDPRWQLMLHIENFEDRKDGPTSVQETRVYLDVTAVRALCSWLKCVLRGHEAGVFIGPAKALEEA